eukprot:14355664-Alexandrium_andersonii.AAC.1
MRRDYNELCRPVFEAVESLTRQRRRDFNIREHGRSSSPRVAAATAGASGGSADVNEASRRRLDELMEEDAACDAAAVAA